MIPTRFIEKEEYERLLSLESGYTMIHSLDAMDFWPPRPAQELKESVSTEHVHLLFLNSVDPCIYWNRAEQSAPFVILPKYDELSYETLQEIHPVKGAWAYRITPHLWDATDWENHFLGHSDYWFKPTPVGTYNKEDVRTH